MEGPIIRLLSFRFNGDAAREEEFNRWYNTVHCPHVTQCPGFLAGYRYRDADDPHSYITLYVFESKEGMAQAMQALKAHLDSEEAATWRNWESGHLTDFARGVYAQLYP